jgi:hypothetical protein
LNFWDATGAPLQIDRPYYSATHLSSLHSQFGELPCNLIHQAYPPGRRVLHISKRLEPANIVHCPPCIWHEPFCYSRRHRPTPKNTSRGNPGCAVGPKTPTIRAGQILMRRPGVIVPDDIVADVNAAPDSSSRPSSSVAPEKNITK